MKALLLHCKDYRIAIGQLANRPKDIKPEVVKEPVQTQQNCILALITVEDGDTISSTKNLADDITRMAKDMGRTSIVLLPFAHLSNKLADSDTSIAILESARQKLAEQFNVKRGHFGSHKEFMFDVFGHPGNARFREY